MNHLYFRSLFLLIFISFDTCFAQKDAVLPSPTSDLLPALQETQDGQDPEAEASILLETGELFYVYPNRNITLSQKVRRSIKIYQKSGLNWGNVVIPLHVEGMQQERIKYLRAFTHNLVQGQIQTVELDADQVYREKRDENTILVKFSLPQVRVGSVVEYEYLIESDFPAFIPDWYFQSSIPTRQSHFTARMPPFFEFMLRRQGEHPFSLEDEQKGKERKKVWVYEFYDNIYQWQMEQVPAFQTESFISNPDDYREKIIFQIAKFEHPGRGYQTFSQTWEELSKDFLKREDFGGYLRDQAKTRDLLAGLQADLPVSSGSLVSIYNKIKDDFQWNNSYRFYSSQSLRKLLEEGRGNSADINLLLVATLREAGFQAAPVILSTRSHGKLVRDYPFWRSFNHVIAHVSLDGKTYLLDATQSLCPHTLMAPEVYNEFGLLISKEETRWVELSSQEQFEEFHNVIIRINPAAKQLLGTYQKQSKGFAALQTRKQIQQSDLETYQKDLQSTWKDFQIKEIQLQNLDDIQAPVATRFSFQQALTEAYPSLIYLSATLGLGVQENPFKHDQRELPIDFTYPRSHTHLLNLFVPEGYEIAELPKSVKLVLPDQSASFLFQVVSQKENIQIMSKFQIHGQFYRVEAYPYLRKLYQAALESHQAQIVLKRKTATNSLPIPEED